MTDYFALLGEPRRPWPDPEAIESRFLALSTEFHPDRVHNAPAGERESTTRRFAEINAARACLRDPKARLLHLIELESGRRPGGIEQPPADALEHFMQVSRLCREIDQFKAERERITSPMLKVKSFERGLALTDAVAGLQQILRESLAGLETELKALNRFWDDAPAVAAPERPAHLPLARLEGLTRSLSFTMRWLSQLQERHAQLAG